MLEAAPGAVHAMRDPTRGGIATTLKEIASTSSVGIEIEEERIPVSEAVGAPARCSASITYTSPTRGSSSPSWPRPGRAVLDAMSAHPYGRDAALSAA